MKLHPKKSRISTPKKYGPRPVRQKRDPKELDKVLDQAVEDSMAASDPPTVSNSTIRVPK